MKEILKKNLNKGENAMKKGLFVFALAMVLVFSVATIAGAKYGGFSPLNSTATPWGEYGVIAWEDAVEIMVQNNVPIGLRGTAHGGYVTTTTKCAACHSAHRASGLPNGTPSNTNQRFLTAGGDNCSTCHTDWGSMTTSKLIEWGETDGGPHRSGRRGCLLCHNSGIHGGSSSRYNVMNVFMLGNTRGRGDDGTNANTFPLAANSRDAQIAREIANLTMGALSAPAATYTGTGTNGAWWADGPRVGAAKGMNPIGGARNADYAAARSLATGYTCSEAGCHQNTVMFNTRWGMGFDRYSTGTGTYAGADVRITGHAMPSLSRQNDGGNNQACGPCHPGSPAGFPTASTVAGRRDDSRRVYGCAQCHDMVGVATNAAAFPHGNRNIKVYEWLASGEQTATMLGASGGNLWMYSGSIARRADLNQGNNPGTTATTQTFQGPTSINPSAATSTREWKVMTGVTNGTGKASAGNTGMLDGACLKCHVTIDAASGGHQAEFMRHGYRPATSITGSSRMFLYK